MWNHAEAAIPILWVVVLESIALAMALRGLFRSLRQRHLLTWSWALAANAAAACLAAMAVPLAGPRGALSSALTGAALGAQLAQGALLLAGGAQLLRGHGAARPIFRWGLGTSALAALGLALPAAFGAIPTGAALGAALSAAGLLTGAAFLVAARWLGRGAEGSTRRPPGLPRALVVYGLGRLAGSAAMVAEAALGRPLPLAAYGPHLETLLLLLFALGLMSWHLDEEHSFAARSSREVERLTYHDPLTQLPSRELFLARLSNSLATARENGLGLAVLFLDLDRFKTINDTLGHDYGDQLLVSVAERLREVARDGDTVSRLGSDELTLLVPNLEETRDAASVAESVREAFTRPFLLHGHEVFVTVSIGAAIFPGDGDSAEILLKHAELAMSQAKAGGPGQLKVYSPVMGARAVERLALESDLRQALERDELLLYYQPVLDVARGRFTSLEALLRWQHPWRGLVRPGEMIPVLEQSGLIDRVDLWVMETACRELRRLHRQGHGQLRMAVNLSARPFRHRDLVARIEAVLAATGLEPQSLEIEITENLAMERAEETMSVLDRLKTLGIRLSIDDFGVGYSSLSYLRSFPIDTVKIDRSFVRNLTQVPDDDSISRAMIAMAHTLKLEVVAEGVETEAQRRFLEEQGCDRLQGYLLGKPMPPEACRSFLDHHQGATAVRLS